MCDFDGPSVMRVATHRSKVQRRCAECVVPILVGEKYTNVWGVWEGRSDSIYFHVACYKMYGKYAKIEEEGGYDVFGSVLSILRR
jgi:hypothetical protein